jgi:hypothetical protein
LTVDSRRSTKKEAAATIAASSSRAAAMEEPTALMWTPSPTHSRRMTGSRELVVVTMMSAP